MQLIISSHRSLYCWFGGFWGAGLTPAPLPYCRLVPQRIPGGVYSVEFHIAAVIGMQSYAASS